MASPHERAWAEGYKAGKHSKAESACPYGSGVMRQQWQAGWRAGQTARDSRPA